MDLPQQWPEPVVPVQSLADSGIIEVPARYIKPPSQRPLPETNEDDSTKIPVIDLMGPREVILQAISEACREWGFFQVVNHGVGLDLIEKMRAVWREFFRLPVEEKTKLANDPVSYQGYGSRLGVEKGAVLDWGDYFYLETFPESRKSTEKWLALPVSCRETIEEYNQEILKLCGALMKVLSVSLGLDEELLKEKFGGEDIQAAIRVNYYPKCPNPNLTLGLSSHSDPGGLTVLLAVDHVEGLQVLKGNKWVTVRSVPNAFVVNIADQIQVISNGVYKSVEHRVIANATKERLSIAFFYNPNNDVPIEPAPELLTPENPARYPRTTYREYRLYIRKKGPMGKSQVESMVASEQHTRA